MKFDDNIPQEMDYSLCEEFGYFLEKNVMCELLSKELLADHIIELKKYIRELESKIEELEEN